MSDEHRCVASDVIGQRIRQIRRRRDLTVEDLSTLCAHTGVDISDQGLFNIENGRRDSSGNRRRHVKVEELLGLALALEVSPLHLLVPLESQQQYPLTPTRPVMMTQMVRDWVRGNEPLPGMDPEKYFGEVPPRELRAAERRRRNGDSRYHETSDQRGARR